MSASESLESRIKRVIVQRLRLKIDPNEIKDDQALFGGEIGLDSIDALELVMGIEKEFGVTIEDAAEGERVLRDVNSIAKFIREQKCE